MSRAIYPIMVAVILMTIAATPVLSTEEPKSGDEGTLRLMIGNDSDGLRIEVITAEGAEIQEFKIKIFEFQHWISNVRPFRDLKLTQEEIDDIKTNILGLLESINALLEAQDYEPLSADWLFGEMFEIEPGRSTIVSVGVGYTFIPFYDYEGFIGVMLRPIWLLYPPAFLGGGGYTGNLNINVIPPRIEYGDKLGGHIVRTTGFSGLYINIGDLGYNSILGGFVLLLGQARVVM